MTYVLIEPSGAHSWGLTAPSTAVLAALVGGVPEVVDTAYDVIGVKATDSDLLQWERNPVAGAMLSLLGADWWPYSGPVVFVQRPSRRPLRPRSLTPDTLRAVNAMHQDVLWALAMRETTVPASPVESIPVAEILKVADYVRSGSLHV